MNKQCSVQTLRLVPRCTGYNRSIPGPHSGGAALIECGPWLDPTRPENSFIGAPSYNPGYYPRFL